MGRVYTWTVSSGGCFSASLSKPQSLVPRSPQPQTSWVTMAETGGEQNNTNFSPSLSGLLRTTLGDPCVLSASHLLNTDGIEMSQPGSDTIPPFYFNIQALIRRCGDYQKETCFHFVPSVLHCTFSSHLYRVGCQCVFVHMCV